MREDAAVAASYGNWLVSDLRGRVTKESTELTCSFSTLLSLAQHLPTPAPPSAVGILVFPQVFLVTLVHVV